MRRRDFLRSTALVAGAAAIGPMPKVFNSNRETGIRAVPDPMEEALRILLSWDCGGTPMDVVVIGALGYSGKAEALYWIENLEPSRLCARDSEYECDIGVARARLDPDWAEQQLLSAEPMLPAEAWAHWVPATPRSLVLLRQRAERGDSGAAFALFETSSEYKGKVLCALAQNEMWPLDVLLPGFLGTMSPADVMPVLAPRFSELDEEIQTEVFRAFFPWRANDWDAEFPKFVAQATGAEEVFFWLPERICESGVPPGDFPPSEAGMADTRPSCCRRGRFLLDIFHHARTPVASIMAGERLLGHGTGLPTSDIQELRSKLDQALADPFPEAWANGGSVAAARVGRWFIARGDRLAPEGFLRIARSAPPQDMIESIFALGYVLEPAAISHAARGIRRALIREYGHDDGDWWMPMRRLAQAVASPSLLEGLDYVRLKDAGCVRALWWNQVTGVKPDLTDWFETARLEDRLALAEHLFSFRRRPVSRNVLRLFEPWRESSLAQERTWGLLLGGEWGGPDWIAQLSCELGSRPFDKSMESAFTALLKSGPEGSRVAVEHFRRHPTDTCGRILYECLCYSDAAEYAPILVNSPVSLVSTVGAACYIRSQSV